MCDNIDKNMDIDNSDTENSETGSDCDILEIEMKNKVSTKRTSGLLNRMNQKDSPIREKAK